MAVWNFENAAHLLRRAAFGGTTEQIQAFLDSYSSVDEAVDDLMSYGGSNKKPPKGGRDTYKAKLKQKQWWLKTMLKAAANPRDALREKVVLFLHSHLCSGFNRQQEYGYGANMAIQNGLFRRYSAGNFVDLVRDFNRDPANLIYLDGIINYASHDGETVGANENFGREVLELFTVGVCQFASDGMPDASKPNYEESDVHQLARALTGWVEIDKDIGIWHDWAWDGGQYDDNGDGNPDDISIFGVTNNNFKISADVAGTADDVLKLIFEQEDDEGNPQAAMYVCWKLWKWFGYPPPAPTYKEMIAGFADVFRDSGYELVPVLTAMFKSEEFYSDLAKTRTVKCPVDYMVGLFTTLGVKNKGRTVGESDTELVNMLEEMGMELYEPPNVAGWPGGQRWITTGTLVNRLEFARRLAEAGSGSSALPLSTIIPIGDAEADPDEVLDAMIRRVGLDGSHAATYQGGIALTSAQRDALRFFLTASNSKTSLDLTDEYTDDAEDLVRGTLALILQSAEAQIF